MERGYNTETSRRGGEEGEEKEPPRQRRSEKQERRGEAEEGQVQRPRTRQPGLSLDPLMNLRNKIQQISDFTGNVQMWRKHPA